VYLSAFSRYPTDSERHELVAAIEKAKAGHGPDAHRQALEDMVWAMLTSKEFLFNH